MSRNYPERNNRSDIRGCRRLRCPLSRADVGRSPPDGASDCSAEAEPRASSGPEPVNLPRTGDGGAVPEPGGGAVLHYRGSTRGYPNINLRIDFCAQKPQGKRVKNIEKKGFGRGLDCVITRRQASPAPSTCPISTSRALNHPPEICPDSPRSPCFRASRPAVRTVRGRCHSPART